MSKTILIDMDDTIVDLHRPWHRVYNAWSGDDVSIEKATSWEVDKWVKNPAIMMKVLELPGLFEDLEPLPGAVAGIEQLVEAGHRVLLVSSAPNPESMKGKAKFVDKRLPFLPPKSLVLTYHKDLVRGDVLFDDGPHNLLRYRKAWPSAQIATIAYPYNYEAAVQSGAFIAGEWQNTAAAWRRFVEHVL